MRNNIGYCLSEPEYKDLGLKGGSGVAPLTITPTNINPSLQLWELPVGDKWIMLPQGDTTMIPLHWKMRLPLGFLMSLRQETNGLYCQWGKGELCLEPKGFSEVSHSIPCRVERLVENYSYQEKWHDCWECRSFRDEDLGHLSGRKPQRAEVLVKAKEIWNG